MDVFGIGALPDVLRVLGRFKRAPEAFLSSHNLDTDNWLTQGAVFISSEQRDEICKLHILQLWQEFAPLLFGESKRVDKTFNALLMQLGREPTETSAFFYSQVLMTMTGMIVAVSGTREHSKLLISLVNKLLDYAKTANSPANRILRGTACQCLTELERCFPGLLSIKLGFILQLAQEETTHVAQSYLLLFATVLKHYLVHVVPTFEVIPQGFASIVHKGLFLIPEHLQESKKIVSDDLVKYVPANLSERNGQWLKDVKRCISFLTDNTAVLTPVAMVDVVIKLLESALTVSLAPEVFKQQFLRLSNSHEPQLVHMVLILRRRLDKEAFNEDDDAFLLRRLVALFTNPHCSDNERIMCSEWILSLAEVIGSDYLYRLRQCFYPLPFESLRIKQAKLRLLCHCFSPSPSPFAPPANILDVVQCVGDFRVLPTFAAASNICFDTLAAFLKRYPELSHQVQAFITKVIFDGPRFIDQVSLLTDRIKDHTPHSRFPVDMLRTLSTSLCNCDVNEFVLHGHDYILLLERICREKEIDPVRPAQYLLDVLRLSSVCEVGAWTLGSLLLRVSRTMLLHHPTSIVFHALKALLAHMSEYYAEVDIRDQAQFLLLILTHVSREKMLRILSPAESVSLDLTVDGLSALGPSLKVTPVVALPFSFICVLRVPMNNHDRNQRKLQRTNFDDTKLEGSLLSYLESLETMPPLLITIDLQIRYDENVFSRKDLAAFPTRVFSLTVDFETPIAMANPIQINIPYLEAPPSSSALVAETLPDRFPFQFTMPVVMQPLVPTPLWFKLTSQFTTADGVAQSAPIEPVRVGFEDLILPIASTTTPRASIVRLFNGLWALYGRLAEAPNEAAPASQHAKNQGDDEEYQQQQKEVTSVIDSLLNVSGFESVKYLNVNGKEMIRLLNERLSPFIVDSTSTDLVSLMFALPPRHHLLCRCRVGADATVVNIRTDTWRVLTYIDSFLDCVVADLPDEENV